MAAVQPSPTRRSRERDLILATRALFDERGMLDAPIEEIAQAVGIARGLVYRHFSSKEELFVLTVTDYLGELAGLLDAALSNAADPVDQLRQGIETYARFCQSYPAFLDSSLSLMHRSARELHEIVSESVWLRLGQSMARCVHHLIRVLENGSASGAFGVSDPEYMANVLWTQVLGVMHLTRTKVGLREAAPGIPELFTIVPERIVMTCVASALATVGARP
jgi:AcrR family transcriptional regulator